MNRTCTFLIAGALAALAASPASPGPFRVAAPGRSATARPPAVRPTSGQPEPGSAAAPRWLYHGIHPSAPGEQAIDSVLAEGGTPVTIMMSSFLLDSGLASVSMTVQGPSGRRYAAGPGADARAEYEESAEFIYKSFRVSGEPAGLWRVWTRNESRRGGEIGVDVFAESEVELEVTYDPDRSGAGGPVRVRAGLKAPGGWLAGSVLTGVVLAPDGGVDSLRFGDDGRGGDVTAGDGVWTSAITPIPVSNVYGVVVQALNLSRPAVPIQRTRTDVLPLEAVPTRSAPSRTR